MNLTIGLLRHDAGWEQLLMQIGVSWMVVPDGASLAPDAFSVVIVNADPKKAELDAIRTYVGEGGAVLGDYGRLGPVFGYGTTARKLTFLKPWQSPPSISSILDLNQTGRVLRAKEVDADFWNHYVMHTFQESRATSVPFDVSRLLKSTRFFRKNFYAETDRLPSEYVAAVSRGPLRELVTMRLASLHHARNLPFVHTWYYPDGSPSIFTFRVDTDKGSKTELSELHDVCTRHNVKGTWFADVKSHEGWLDFFRTFKTQEIGLHCYEHRTDANVGVVRENFSKGVNLLREAGFDIRGASAPTGRWNEAVDTVYRELGIEFSSEFSLVYDDLPSFPVVGGEPSPVLQLPVHPVCVGNMRRSAFTSEQMKSYFRMWIDNRLLSREPVCLYHHPTHHHWEVFDDAFAYVAARKIPCMTYGDYASWWRTRTSSVPRFTFDDGIVGAEHVADDPRMRCRIAFADGTEIITPINGTFDTRGARREKPPVPPTIPADVERARKFDPRHVLLNILDHWYKLRS